MLSATRTCINPAALTGTTSPLTTSYHRSPSLKRNRSAPVIDLSVIETSVTAIAQDPLHKPSLRLSYHTWKPLWNARLFARHAGLGEHLARALH